MNSHMTREREDEGGGRRERERERKNRVLTCTRGSPTATT